MFIFFLNIIKIVQGKIEEEEEEEEDDKEEK